MKPRLPPMHTLTALEAFVRAGSVGGAAEVLGVTRSAVSHRLAMLERMLGFKLINRSGKGVELTSRGKRYAQDVHKSLSILTDAVNGEQQTHMSGTLRICSTAGFASMWLCTHIGAFLEAYPNLRLEITTYREIHGSSSTDADLFIAFGRGLWPNYSVIHLYDPHFTPVCSPSLLRAGGGLATPADVLRFPLLHLEGRNEWENWLAKVQVALPAHHVGITVSDIMLALAAAIAGQGIMMGDDVTCSTALSTGQLIAPFPVAITTNDGYYIVNERHERPNPAVIAFTRWLQGLIAHRDSAA
jgi:LysR family transcriptional regulator, glycine cleavage system transcriptional activator